MFDLSTKSGRKEYIKEVTHSLYLEDIDYLIKPTPQLTADIKDFIDGKVGVEIFEERRFKKRG